MFSDGAPALRQGAILRDVPFTVIDAAELGLLLTPECDLVQDKAVTALFVYLVPASEFIRGLAEGHEKFKDGDSGNLVGSPSKDARNSFLDKIRRIQENNSPRYHWIDQLPDGAGPFVADFQFLACVPLETVTNLPVAANLADPFRSAVPARYAAYAGRVGTPDLDEAALLNYRQSQLDAIFPVNVPPPQVA